MTTHTSGTAVVRANLHDRLHAQALVDLLDGYASDAMGGGEPLPAFTRNNLAQALSKRPGTHVILVFCDGQAAGLLNAMEGFSTFTCKPILNVHDVAVAKAFQGRGLSRLLFEEAEAIAREIGACKLTLEVLSGNSTAKAAYSRFGYAPYALDEAMGQAQFWQKILL